MAIYWVKKQPNNMRQATALHFRQWTIEGIQTCKIPPTHNRLARRVLLRGPTNHSRNIIAEKSF